MKKVIGICAVVLTLALVVSPLYAGGKGCCGKSKSKVCEKAKMILMNSDELGLSDEQVEKIKQITMRNKKEMIKRGAELEVVALDIKSAMYSEKPDVEAINKLIDKKYDLKKAKAKAMVAAYAELKGVLSASQMKALKDLYKKCDKDKACMRR